VQSPISGVGGISNIDDVMEFLVAGASAVQIGTANFFDPTLATRLVGQLDEILTQEGLSQVSQIVGTLKTP
jgi:dihydroorotate dehydrogenase (NAD+) catalytic subunit